MPGIRESWCGIVPFCEPSCRTPGNGRLVMTLEADSFLMYRADDDGEPLYAIMASNWLRGKKGPTLTQPRLTWPGCLPAN
jgi:hypothetical protein